MSLSPLIIASWQTLPKDNKSLLALFQQTLNDATQSLYQAFEAGEKVEDLLLQRTELIDFLLQKSLTFFIPNTASGIALIAAGGYGRKELLPFSDIDILLLCHEDFLQQHRESLAQFITFLWDTGLKIGHSVRTLSESIEQAEKDITIVTNLIESRLIDGDSALYQQLMRAISVDHMWPSRDFFLAKRDEQLARHKKYNNNEYRLEPNIKSSPGGLRDIQMIGWISKRHFNLPSIDALLNQGFLTHQEYEIMINGQSFLLKIRFALHMLNKRDENRLSFDQQAKIAHYFGLEDGKTLAIEQLMKKYYRWAQTLNQLNDLIMQLFDENILHAHKNEIITPLNARFQLRDQQIETTATDIFLQYPSALLEIFVLMAKHRNIVGVRADTIRQIRTYNYLLDDNFRNQSKNKQLFVELLRSQEYVATSLNLMKRYGILDQYIPAFGEITGQLQHDLFHIYTVDAHTIQVLKNARRLVYGDIDSGFEFTSRIAQTIQKKDLLYLACLFHDIGKGRGGNHSILGAVDALEFCRQHGYSQRDCKLVSWLVEQHLLMSQTAQKKDLSDPNVIHQFALTVADIQHLDYLFVLTVADINGTNPSLWNSWRASLLRSLYSETKLALRRGLENVIDRQELIDEKQQQALSGLLEIGANKDIVELIWSNAGDDYFLRESTEDIVWQTKAITERMDSSSPLVLIQQSPNPLFHGATQIFIHTKDTTHIFASVAAVLEHLQLTIVDAKIYSSSSGYTLDTFMVLDENNALIDDHKRLLHIQQTLEYYLQRPDEILKDRQYHSSRRLRHLNFATRTRITLDKKRGVSVLEVITADRPGLLAAIGRIFVRYHIELKNAKIATLGERVEDIFFITDQAQQPLYDNTLCEDIQQAIKTHLDEVLTQKA